jgi:hypothetical protein
LAHELLAPEGVILKCGDMENAPQPRIGLINEILSEEIFIRVVPAPWRY